MPYTSDLPDTLFVDGTDIQALAGVAMTDFSGLLAPGLRRARNDVVPGRQGQLGNAGVFDAYQFSIPVTVLPHDSSGDTPSGVQAARAQTLSNYTMLATKCAGTAGTGLCSLTRRLTATSSTSTDVTAAGQFVQIANVRWLDLANLTAELQFVNLDGAWRRVSDGVLCWP